MGTAFRPARGAGLWHYCTAIPYFCTGFGYGNLIDLSWRCFWVTWPVRAAAA